MAINIFRSQRLTYTPLDTLDTHPQHDATLASLRRAPTFWNGDIALPTPGGTAQARGYHRILSDNCCLAVYICLSPSSSSPTTGAAATSSFSNTSTSAGIQTSASNDNDDGNLTAIGILTLSKEGPENHGHHGAGSAGMELLPAYQGQGYGSEALVWLQWYAFEIARLHRLGIQCVEWNVGALRLYERLGWRVEGCARESVWFMGGWWGTVSLGLLEGEWRKAQMEKAHEKGMGMGRGMGSLSKAEMARLMDCE